MAGVFLVVLLGGLVPSFYVYQVVPSLKVEIFFILLISIFFVFFLSKKVTDKNYAPILLCLAVVTWFFRYLFVFSYDQDFSSDFRTMWNYAINISQNGWSRPDVAATERATTWLAPLVYVFGTSNSVFKIFNITVITLQNLMCASMVRRWHSSFAGLLCFLLLSFVPEFYFASLIPSHDISGSFYAITCLFIFSFLIDLNLRTQIILFIFLFFSLTFFEMLLEVNRGIFLVPWISFLLLTFYFLLKSKEKSAQLKFFVLFFLLLIQGVMVKNVIFSLRNGGILEPHRLSRQYKFYFNNGHSLSRGSFSEGLTFWQSYAGTVIDNDKLAQPVGFEDFKFYLKSILGSDLYYNGHNRFENYTARFTQVMRYIGLNGFYNSRLKGVEKVEQAQISQNFKEANYLYLKIFSVLLLISFFYCFIDAVFFRRLNEKFCLPLLYVSVFCLALCLLSEVQPRYFYLCWAPWGMIVSGVFGSIFSKKENVSSLRLDLKGPILLALILSLLVFSFLFFFSKTDYKIFDMRTFSEPTCSESISKKECSHLKVKFEDNFFQKAYAMLKLKPLRGESGKNTVSVEKSVQVKPNEEGIFSFYILPHTKDIKKAPPVRVNIYVNKELKKKVHFPIKPIFITLPLVKAKEETLKIRFELESLAPMTTKEQNQSILSFDFLTFREKKL
jgi:hypothetical protein